MKKIKLTEQDLTNIVKRVILEDEKPKKKLFTPKNIDEREKEYQQIIKKRLEDLKNTPIGELSKDFIFEWIQENNIDQQLKKMGKTIGDVYGTSYNKSTGDVTLFIDTYDLDTNVAIKFKISDIQVGTFDMGPDDFDETFYPLN